MNEFFVYPIEIWAFGFWVFATFVSALAAGSMFYWLIESIFEANFITSKLVFWQVTTPPNEFGGFYPKTKVFEKDDSPRLKNFTFASDFSSTDYLLLQKFCENVKFYFQKKLKERIPHPNKFGRPLR